MLKILFFNWRDVKNPCAGGAEIYTHEVAKRWVKSGNEVTLFTSRFRGSMKETSLDGVRIVRSGSRYTVYLMARKYYRSLFSREKYDIVLDEINTIPFFTPKFVNNGEKVFALIHQLAREFWFYETPFPLNFIGFHFLEKRWLSNYFAVPTITVSESTKKDLINLGFNQVHVIPGGCNIVPLEEMPEKSDEPSLVYVGRLTKAKRVDWLVLAFVRVEKELPKAKLWIIGHGEMREKLKEIASDSVQILGKVSEATKIDLLKRAWILAYPSVREGFPLAIIEAAGCGTPCVAYDVEGLRDAIKKDQTGVLVRPGNIEALAEAIVETLKGDHLRRMSENALRNAKEYSWDRTAQRLLYVVSSVTD